MRALCPSGLVTTTSTRPVPGVRAGTTASVRAVVPARTPGTGLVDVVVTNPDGQSARIAEAFRYVDRQAPIIHGMEPTSGPTHGGTGVLVRGEHLETVTQVL